MHWAKHSGGINPRQLGSRDILLSFLQRAKGKTMRDDKIDRSMRHAINQNCKECIYDPKVSGTWRKQVEECTCDQCPFYAHRPRTQETIIRMREEKKEKKKAKVSA